MEVIVEPLTAPRLQQKLFFFNTVIVLVLCLYREILDMEYNKSYRLLEPWIPDLWRYISRIWLQHRVNAHVLFMNSACFYFLVSSALWYRPQHVISISVCERLATVVHLCACYSTLEPLHSVLRQDGGRQRKNTQLHSTKQSKCDFFSSPVSGM